MDKRGVRLRWNRRWRRYPPRAYHQSRGQIFSDPGSAVTRVRSDPGRNRGPYLEAMPVGSQISYSPSTPVDFAGIELDIEAGIVCGVKVEWGQVPDRLANALVSTPLLEADDDCVLLRARGARVLVERGERVIVSPLVGARDVDLRSLYYGWIPSLIMLWRGCFFLHATTVAKAGVTLAITGMTGSGKSTTGAALTHQDWKLVCDDTTPIIVRDGFPRVVPYRRPLHLLPDAVDIAPAGSEFAGSLPFRDKSAFQAPQDLRRQRLTGVVSLRRLSAVTASSCVDHAASADPDSAILIEELTGIAAFKAVERNLHARAALRTPGRRPAVTRWIEMIARLPVTAISRPAGMDTLAEVTNVIGTRTASTGD